MKQHAPVYQKSFLLQYWNYVSLIRFARIILNTFLILLSFQILTSVPLISITVMPMLSAVTLRGLITAHAALDTLEMEHHASVNHRA